MENIFDDMYTIFKNKMGQDGVEEGGGKEPMIVNTIIKGKLVPVDLNIAISS